jgi:Zn-dependent M28 family amino/carboxypeptidase
MRRNAFLLLLLAAVALTGISARELTASLPRKARGALDGIDADRIRAHVKFLSSDLLEGRGTGQRGGDIAAAYIASQMEITGLRPGAEDGGYLQRVPLIGITTEPGSTLKLATARGSVPLKTIDDYVAWSRTEERVTDQRSEVIFVGYGIVAPELDWDDYKGADVRGKTLLMLVNDPPSPDPAFFGGPALSYYGRWTYKFEIGLKKGAAGVILIHTTPSAGYGFNVVQNSWSKEQPFPARAPGDGALKLEAWITEARGRELFKLCGRDLDRDRDSAARRDFQPIPLGATATSHIVSKVRKFETANVLGLLEGSDPLRKDEVVIFTSHYDHLGLGKAEKGDAIFNGAVDNASGVAVLLEIARAYRAAALRGARPPRSILFMATAAEEGGLRGSQYYADHPTFSPRKIAAALNIDGIQILGKALTYTFLGAEKTTLGPVIAWAAREYGFQVVPDTEPGQGSYFRSDHFPFARIGVPAISIDQGDSFEGRDPEWGKRQWEEYNRTRYHRPGDEYDPEWDFSGLVRTGQITGAIGWMVASQPEIPPRLQADASLGIPATAGGPGR